MNKDELIDYCLATTIDKKKLDILVILSKKKKAVSLTKISDEMEISLPLVSYHINGNLTNKGLYEFGLVEFALNRNGHHVGLKITPLGLEILQRVGVDL